jgi:SpoIIAA-like
VLEILPSADHVCAVRIFGVLDGRDYDVASAAIAARLARHDKISVLADCSALRRVTLTAALRDLRRFVGKLPELHRISRLALVTDHHWLNELARLADGWYPFEIHGFPAAERTAAITWASENTSKPRAGLRLLRTTSPGTYAYVWDGELTRATVEQVLGRLRDELERHEEVRLIGLIEGAGMETLHPAAFLQSSLLRVKQLGFRKLERYAIVGGPRWLARSISLLSLLGAVNMRHFERENEAAAWEWIDAQPALDLQHLGRMY